MSHVKVNGEGEIKFSTQIRFVTLVLLFLVAAVPVIINWATVGNDVSHIQTDMSEIKETIKTHSVDIQKNTVGIARLEK